MNGLSDSWLSDIRRWLHLYLEYVNWTINLKRTLKYLNKINNIYSTTSYRKKVYQIRKFLTYLNVDWAKDIKPPSEPYYTPKRITIEDIKNALTFFEGHKSYRMLKTLILIASTSGLRAHELYQLTLKDIDTENRIVHINHLPSNGQTTKTKISRISFFNNEAKNALIDYISREKNLNPETSLFSERKCQNLFENVTIKVKDFRKFFSQEWDRRGGQTSIKKILMGHSIRNDVDLMHYNCQSEEDLKIIYDRVMNTSILIENPYR